MGIFSSKIELSNKIKEQAGEIERLKSERESYRKEISELRDAVNELSKANSEYERRYVNTNLECEFCYTTLQKEFAFCPKCGKKIQKSAPEVVQKAASSTFTTERDGEYTLITQYNGFNDKKIVIPSMLNGRKVIGVWNGVFEKCADLEEVVFEEGCRYIGKDAFSKCTKLKRVRLPKSLLEIGDRAFHCCELLEEIAVPPNVNVIGIYAFSCCTNLKRIILPENLQYISQGMLSSTGISEINIPQSIVHIAYSAFGGTKLTKVELPRNLYSIADNAFAIKSLKEIVIHSNVKIICRHIFGSSYGNIAEPVIYCAAGSKAQLYARKYGLECREIPPAPHSIAQICASSVIVGSFAYRNASMEQLYHFIGLNKAATWSWKKGISRIDIEKIMNMNDAQKLASQINRYIDTVAPGIGKIHETAVCKHWGEPDV